MKNEMGKSKITRAISFLTLGFFLMNQVTFANPGAGIEIAFKGELPAYLSINIPTELGTVDTLYEAPSSANPQFILHIQDAHANYEAQMKIKQLLGYMDKQYGFKTIFVEGASEKLNADYLRLFPDEESNLKLCDELAKQGELTGAELFLMEQSTNDGRRRAEGVKTGSTPSSILHPSFSPAVEAIGIEKASLYKSNYDALKKVFGAAADVERFFKGFDAQLDRAASKIFTPETRGLIADWKRFEQGRREFMPFVKGLAKQAKKTLDVDLESLFAQVSWPQITRLLVIQQMEKELDKAKGVEEQAALIKMLRGKGVSKELLTALEKFGEGSVSVGKSEREVSPRQLLERLASEVGSKGFQFSDYPHFSLYAGHVILRSELDPKALFEEIERLFTRMLDASAKEPQQQTLLALYRDGELLRKLLHLELNRAQWRQAVEAKDRIAIPSLVARLKDAVQTSSTLNAQRATERTGSLSVARSTLRTPVGPTGDVIPPTFAKTMDEIFSAGFKFYDFARQRENVFYQEMQTVMHERKLTKAILITGGFHTDGMSDLFRENAVSYGIVTPRLSEKSDEGLYRTTMLQSREYLFSISNLQMTAKLMSLYAWEAHGVDRNAIFAVILNAMMKAKGQGIDKVVDVFNRWLLVEINAPIMLVRDGIDAQGKPAFQIVPRTPAADVSENVVIGDVAASMGSITAPAIAPASRSEVRGDQLTADSLQPTAEALSLQSTVSGLQFRVGKMVLSITAAAILGLASAGLVPAQEARAQAVQNSAASQDLSGRPGYATVLNRISLNPSNLIDVQTDLLGSNVSLAEGNLTFITTGGSGTVQVGPDDTLVVALNTAGKQGASGGFDFGGFELSPEQQILLQAGSGKSVNFYVRVRNPWGQKLNYFIEVQGASGKTVKFNLGDLPANTIQAVGISHDLLEGLTKIKTVIVGGEDLNGPNAVAEGRTGSATVEMLTRHETLEVFGWRPLSVPANLFQENLNTVTGRNHGSGEEAIVVIDRSRGKFTISIPANLGQGPNASGDYAVGGVTFPISSPNLGGNGLPVWIISTAGRELWIEVQDRRGAKGRFKLTGIPSAGQGGVVIPREALIAQGVNPDEIYAIMVTARTKDGAHKGEITVYLKQPPDYTFTSERQTGADGISHDVLRLRDEATGDIQELFSLPYPPYDWAMTGVSPERFFPKLLFYGATDQRLPKTGGLVIRQIQDATKQAVLSGVPYGVDFLPNGTVSVTMRTDFRNETQLGNVYRVDPNTFKTDLTGIRLITQGTAILKEGYLIIQEIDYSDSNNVVFKVTIYNASAGTDHLVKSDRGISYSASQATGGTSGGLYRMIDVHRTSAGVILTVSIATANHTKTLIMNLDTGAELALDGAATGVTYQGDVASYTFDAYGTKTTNVDLRALSVTGSYVFTTENRGNNTVLILNNGGSQELLSLPRPYTLTGTGVSLDGGLVYFSAIDQYHSPATGAFRIQRVNNPNEGVTLLGVLDRVEFLENGAVLATMLTNLPDGTQLGYVRKINPSTFQAPNTFQTNLADIRLIRQGANAVLTGQYLAIKDYNLYGNSYKVTVFDTSKGTDHMTEVGSFSYVGGPGGVGDFKFVDVRRTSDGQAVLIVSITESVPAGVSNFPPRHKTFIKNLQTGAQFKIDNSVVTAVTQQDNIVTFTLLRTDESTKTIIMDLTALPIPTASNPNFYYAEKVMQNPERKFYEVSDSEGRPVVSILKQGSSQFGWDYTSTKAVTVPDVSLYGQYVISGQLFGTWSTGSTSATLRPSTSVLSILVNKVTIDKVTGKLAIEQYEIELKRSANAPIPQDQIPSAIRFIAPDIIEATYPDGTRVVSFLVPQAATTNTIPARSDSTQRSEVRAYLGSVVAFLSESTKEARRAWLAAEREWKADVANSDDWRGLQERTGWQQASVNKEVEKAADAAIRAGRKLLRALNKDLKEARKAVQSTRRYLFPANDDHVARLRSADFDNVTVDLQLRGLRQDEAVVSAIKKYKAKVTSSIGRSEVRTRPGGLIGTAVKTQLPLLTVSQSVAAKEPTLFGNRRDVLRGLSAGVLGVLLWKLPSVARGATSSAIPTTILNGNFLEIRYPDGSVSRIPTSLDDLKIVDYAAIDTGVLVVVGQRVAGQPDRGSLWYVSYDKTQPPFLIQLPQEMSIRSAQDMVFTKKGMEITGPDGVVRQIGYTGNLAAIGGFAVALKGNYLEIISPIGKVPRTQVNTTSGWGVSINETGSGVYILNKQPEESPTLSYVAFDNPNIPIGVNLPAGVLVDANSKIVFVGAGIADITGSEGVTYRVNLNTGTIIPHWELSNAVTIFPGNPVLRFFNNGAPLPYIQQISSSAFSVDYDVKSTGSYSGAVFDWGAEGQNLSGLEAIVLEMKMDAPGSGPSFKLEIKDGTSTAAGYISGLTASYGRVSVPMAAIRQHFPGLDLTRVKEITFVFENTALENKTGRLSVRTGGLSYIPVMTGTEDYDPGAITVLPGSPVVSSVASSGNHINVSQTSSRDFSLNYDLAQDGFAFATVGKGYFDNNGTGPWVGSTFSLPSLTVAAKGPPGKQLKVEVVDVGGRKSIFYLSLTWWTTKVSYTWDGSAGGIPSGFDYRHVAQINFVPEQRQVGSSGTVQIELGGGSYIPTFGSASAVRSEVRENKPTVDSRQPTAKVDSDLKRTMAAVAVARKLDAEKIPAVREARLGFKLEALKKLEKILKGLKGEGVNTRFLAIVLVTALAGGITAPEISAEQMEALQMIAKAQETPLPVVVQQVRGILNIGDGPGLMIQQGEASGTATGEAALLPLANPHQYKVVVWMAANAKEKVVMETQALEEEKRLFETDFAKKVHAEGRFKIVVFNRKANPVDQLNQLVSQLQAKMTPLISREQLNYVLVGDLNFLKQFDSDTVRALMIERPVDQGLPKQTAIEFVGAKVSQRIVAAEIRDAVAGMLNSPGAKSRVYSVKSDVLSAMLTVALQALQVIGAAA